MAQSYSTNSNQETGPGVTGFVRAPASITQSTDINTITPSNSVSCNDGLGHTDNSYLRRFLLNADHGITGQFDVTSVDFAIENATSGSGNQPITVNLYSIPTASPLLFANLTLIGSQGVSIPDQSLMPLNVTVAGTIADPTTTDLVVEVFTPNGQTAGNIFFIGSNANGESRPSYLAAADCSVPEPATTASVGFPGMNIIMVVNGNETTAAVPTLSGGALALLGVLLVVVAARLGSQRRRPSSHAV
jgi:hypothetical protein